MRLQAATVLRMNAVLGPSAHGHAEALASPAAAAAARSQPAHAGPGQQQLQHSAKAVSRRADGNNLGGGHGMSARASHKGAVDAGETFQRPSPGDSNTSETTASPSARVSQPPRLCTAVLIRAF